MTIGAGIKETGILAGAVTIIVKTGMIGGILRAGIAQNMITGSMMTGIGGKVNGETLVIMDRPMEHQEGMAAIKTGSGE
jgi:hypothetical protein